RLDVGGVHADGVGDLGGGVDVDVGGVGEHAPEQGDVDRAAGVGDLLGPLLVLRILQERLDVGAPLHRQFGQAVALARAEEHQVGGLGRRVLLVVLAALGLFDLGAGRRG